jgi:hypothetical protein
VAVSAVGDGKRSGKIVALFWRLEVHRAAWTPCSWRRKEKEEESKRRKKKGKERKKWII